MGLFRRCVPCLLLIAALSGCSSTSSQQEPLSVAELQEVSGNVPAGYIEIQGVSAGTFNPSYWQNDTLNWVPDVRAPLLPPQATGQYQNIYSPWPLEQPNGWRVFYGGWDGSDTPNDRVYSITTGDFLTFDNRTLVIDHGVSPWPLNNQGNWARLGRIPDEAALTCASARSRIPFQIG
jgi:hypothetical protein